MPQFSLVIPTRERIAELHRLFASLAATVETPSEIEILLAIDNDDFSTIQTLPFLNEKFPQFTIKPCFRDSSGEFVFINRDYYNWLAEQSTGKYIWVSADDLVYNVLHWDTLIARYIESYLADKPDRIMCAGIKDNTPKPSPHLPPFPCFPLVTREAFNYFKFVLHPFVPTWGADYLLYLLYFGAERYYLIDDAVYLNHISYHTHQCEADKVTKRIGHTFNRLKMIAEYNIDRAAADLIPQQVAQFKYDLANGRIK
jgi:hypothetical protein